MDWLSFFVGLIFSVFVLGIVIAFIPSRGDMVTKKRFELESLWQDRIFDQWEAANKLNKERNDFLSLIMDVLINKDMGVGR